MKNKILKNKVDVNREQLTADIDRKLCQAVAFGRAACGSKNQMKW